jgi:hypothetical protein
MSTSPRRHGATRGAKFNDRGAVVHCDGEHNVELLRTTVGQPHQRKLVSRTHNNKNVVEAVRPAA